MRRYLQEIIIIVAMSENWVIGDRGKIPWHIREDMIHFQELTMGFPCIMGRITYESLPKRPLKGRPNIILSRSNYHSSGVQVFSTLHYAISKFSQYPKIFICGGAEIYREAIGIADRIELTLVSGSYVGDAFFPEIKKQEWDQVNCIEKSGFKFISYLRKDRVN